MPAPEPQQLEQEVVDDQNDPFSQRKPDLSQLQKGYSCRRKNEGNV
jgi:hypothetical protein